MYMPGCSRDGPGGMTRYNPDKAGRRKTHYTRPVTPVAGSALPIEGARFHNRRGNLPDPGKKSEEPAAIGVSQYRLCDAFRK